MRTLRQQDSQGESAVAAFLDEYFYPKKVTNFCRKTDKKSQLRGIDVTFDYEDKHCIVDEKAAVQYVNRDLPTFAFEINCYGRDYSLQEGWLYDKKKVTEYYLLSWIKATKVKNFESQDITELEILLLNRKKLRKILAEEGLNRETTREIAKKLRQNKQFGVSHKSEKPYYFYHTQHLMEQPINVVIKKWVLRQLSEFCFIIGSEGE
ncbi:MAG: hypothetical protein ACPG19_05695 [Saprospiraceae bacterium]